LGHATWHSRSLPDGSEEITFGDGSLGCDMREIFVG